MLQTASTATATTALADDQQEAARAITCANEAAEGHRAAQFERDGAFSTVVDLREEMTVQTASTTTVTTALAATQEEAARATSWANQAAAGRRAAERERDCVVATTTNLQEALAVQTAPTITATTGLAAAQQEASRTTSSGIDAAHAAQSERDRALSTVVDLPEELAVQTAATITARVMAVTVAAVCTCLLYTSPSPRDKRQSRMPSSA